MSLIMSYYVCVCVGGGGGGGGGGGAKMLLNNLFERSFPTQNVTVFFFFEFFII